MCYAKEYERKDYFAKLEIVMQENLKYFNWLITNESKKQHAFMPDFA